MQGKGAEGESKQRSGIVPVDMRKQRDVHEEEINGMAEGQQARTQMQVRGAYLKTANRSIEVCEPSYTGISRVTSFPQSFVPRGCTGEREDLHPRHGGRSMNEDDQACSDTVTVSK